MMQNLPPNRQLKKLSEVAILMTGTTPPSEEKKYFMEEVEWFTPGDFGDNKILSNSKRKISQIAIKEGKAKIYPANSLLLVAIGATIGKIGIIRHEGSSNQQITSICFNQLVNVDFGYYWFLLHKNDILTAGSTATLPIINQKGINSLSIKFPPLATQHAITRLLDDASASIRTATDALHTQIRQLDELRASTLDEMFGNEKWKKVKLGEIVEKSGQINPGNDPDTMFTYIDISSVDKDIQKITNPNSFLGKDAPSRAKKHIQKGDIVFATTRPNLKNIAIIEDDYQNVVASTGFCVLRPTIKILRNYLFFFLISNKLQENISPFIRGAQYPAISDKDLLSVTIPLPDLATQTAIVSRLDHLSQSLSFLRSSYTTQLTHHDELRASILDQAFSGQLIQG